jgi:hypothetical protein
VTKVIVDFDDRNFPFGKMSVRQNVRQAKCLSAKCLSASAFFKEFSLGGQNRKKMQNLSRRGWANARV